MKTYLYLTTVVAGMMIGGNTWAQCVSTQDCTALGYTESSCPNGGVKCPFGNKWFCGRSDEQCMELACDELGFKYDCVGTNIAGGEGTECNGKYVACKCASGYGWQDSSCQEIVMNGPDGEVYRCNGSVLGVKTADMDFYVAMYDSGKVEYDDIGNTTYSFCADTPGVIPTKEQLLTIYKNHERAVAITCYDNFVDTALIQAISFLNNSEHTKALIIIADEKLPESYEAISKDINYSFAFSCIISKEDADINMNMIDSDIKKDENSIIDFIKFISTDNTNLKLGKIELTKK